MRSDEKLVAVKEPRLDERWVAWSEILTEVKLVRRMAGEMVSH